MSDVQDTVDTAEAPAPATDAQVQSGLGDRYEFAYPDGEKFEARSRDELDKFFKGHYFRQKDYTRKTQEHAKRVAEFEKQQADFQKQFEAIQKQKTQFDEIDKTLRTRPDLYRQLSQVARSPASTTDAFDRAREYADEQLKAVREEVEALKKERQAEAAERELAEIMGAMKGKYPDFNEARVRELLNEMVDGNLEPLIRNLHFASRGMDPKLQQKMAEKLAQKQGAGMVPSGGVTLPSSGKRFKNLDEAAEAAKRELGS